LPSSGSGGLPGFVQSFRGRWRGALLRFAGAFALLALLWLALAPVYAHLLASVARPLIPILEATPGTRYRVEGLTIVAARRIPLPEKQEVVTIQRTLWDGAADYNVAPLAALLLATPGWSWRQRGRAVGWGLGLLVLSQLAFLAVNAEYTQLWPIPTKYGLCARQGSPERSWSSSTGSTPSSSPWGAASSPCCSTGERSPSPGDARTPSPQPTWSAVMPPAHAATA
jgi:hypothetical protein